jgi:hypothetical protein
VSGDTGLRSSTPSPSAASSLVLGIANVNLWNRLNAATRQIVGAW